MIRETYKGRKIKIVKGSQSLYVKIFVNGENLGEWIGTERGELDWVKRTVDAVDRDTRPCAYSKCWYSVG